jgi:hypothetical protein
MEQTFETPQPIRLHVENEVGPVNVIARPDVSTTVVSLIALSPEAEEVITRATIECRATGSTHAVVVKIPRRPARRASRCGAVAVHVELPEGSDVALSTAAGEIEVTGTVGSADLKTASGRVATDDISGGLRVATASGHVSVASVRGWLRMRTASGDLRCARAGGAVDCASTTGDVEIGAADDTVKVDATSGEVRLGELHQGARVANVSGNVRVRSLEGGRLDVRSVSGDVAVGVATGVDLYVDVSTMGAFSSDIPINDHPGAGGSGIKVEVAVSSVTGNVDIGRALEQVA